MSEEIRRLVPPQAYQRHFSKISFKTSFGNCVHQALTKRKWNEVDNNSYNLQWCQKQRVNDVFEQGISTHQRVNHFRLYTQLCKKDLMIKNIKKYKRELSKTGNLKQQQWQFYPLTFFLPSQFSLFLEEFKKNGGVWILKPTGRCQGSGIFLINKLEQVLPFRNKVVSTTNPTVQPNKQQTAIQKKQSFRQKMSREKSRNKVEQKKYEKEANSSNDQKQETDQIQQQDDKAPRENQSYIIQKYIHNPLLFGSKKFDLRIYVLCTNYSQLTVWLYRSGFARFTHEPYDTQDIENLNSHLTNVQIQKHSQNYDEVRGGKWLLDRFKHYLFSRYGQIKTNKTFTQIKDIIIRSLRSVQKSILPSKSSFELYGYDFMIDSNLKPWLIQINGGPSMTANTEFDCNLKCGLIDDVLSILDLEGILQGNQMNVGGFDLILKQSINVKPHHMFANSTFLGAKNQRIKVMKNIAKSFMKNYKQKLKKKHDQNAVLEEKLVENHQKKLQPSKKADKGGSIQKKNEVKKNNNLLPDFYYKKVHKVDQGILEFLKEELQFLDEQSHKFMPLGIASNRQ